MIKATEAQIKALEAALADQFYLIVQGLTLRYALVKKFGDSSEAVKKYNAVIFPKINSWIQREGKYEAELLKKGFKGGLLASGNLKYNDFFNYDKLPDLWKLANAFNTEKKMSGIGFIPLLIWAVIAIVGAFSATVIVDDLTTTTKEKEELMSKTQQTCKDLGLTKEQCASMISQTQAEVSDTGGLGDFLKIGLYFLLGFGIYKVATNK